MKIDFRAIWKRILNPPTWAKALTFSVTLVSAVAALCAVRISPTVVHYLVPSHASYEIGYQLAMDAMHLQPMLLPGMRLGEGSGCPLAFEVLSAACAVINDMATFDQAGIDDGYLDEIREGDKFSVEENV